jgi:Zn-dependent peptidase ImmA (M78 family)
MKLIKTEEQTWSLKDISHAYGMSVENLRYRLLRLNMYPTTHNGKYTYRLTQNDINTVLESVKRKDDIIPKIIYVTREIRFFESKSNFWSDKKIEKTCAKFL